jgi:hypothetical protein
MKPRSTSATRRLVAVAVSRLVRFFNFLFMSPESVSSRNRRGAFEQVRVYVEVIPRHLTNVVCKPVDHISDLGNPPNDPYCSQTIHDAIINAEAVASSIAEDVMPQNLLFVFAENVEALRDGLKGFTLPPSALDPIDPATGYPNEDQRNRRQEKNPENRAIILCKFGQPESIAKAIACKKQHPRYKSNRYEIAWSELQEFKQWLEEIEHLNSLANDERMHHYQRRRASITGLVL